MQVGALLDVRRKFGVASVAGFVELFTKREHGDIALVFGLRLSVLGYFEELVSETVPVSSGFAPVRGLEQQLTRNDQGGGPVLDVLPVRLVPG